MHRSAKGAQTVFITVTIGLEQVTIIKFRLKLRFVTLEGTQRRTTLGAATRPRVSAGVCVFVINSPQRLKCVTGLAKRPALHLS